MCLARYAAQLTRLVATVTRGSVQSAKATPCCGSAPGQIASPPQRSDGDALTLHIHRRAIRLHNRSREGAERYVKVQTILSKGRSCD
jgi:hypothetical protein